MSDPYPTAAPAPSLPPSQPAPAGDTPKTDAAWSGDMAGALGMTHSLCLALERENAALTADLAAARAEGEIHKKLAESNGILAHDEAIKAAALRGALEDVQQLAYDCDSETDLSELATNVYMKCKQALTGSAGAGCSLDGIPRYLLNEDTNSMEPHRHGAWVQLFDVEKRLKLPPPPAEPAEEGGEG